MTESDRLVAMHYAASTHTLEEFLDRYEECVAALRVRRDAAQSARDSNSVAEIGDSLGGPA